MDQYIAEVKGLAAQLEALGSPMDEGMLTTILFESFRTGKDSDYASAIAALQTKKELNWHQVSAPDDAGIPVPARIRRSWRVAEKYNIEGSGYT